MKNLVSKLLPLISKFKDKKPIVTILSVLAIAAVIFAIQKGYIAEDSIKLDTIVDYVSQVFADSVETALPADSVIISIDTLGIEVVDSIPVE